MGFFFQPLLLFPFNSAISKVCDSHLQRKAPVMTRSVTLCGGVVSG